MIAAHAVLTLEMPDDGLDRRTASPVTLEPRCHAPLRPHPAPATQADHHAAHTGDHLLDISTP